MDIIKKRRLNVVIATLLIFFVVIFMVYGFSAFNSSLDITSSSIVRLSRDIRVTSISVGNTTNSGVGSNLGYSVDKISSTVTLPNSNSTVTYTFTITNIGNTEMGILSITKNFKLNGSNTSNIKITNITGYDENNPSKLCDDNNSSLCKLGAVSTISVTIGYDTNGYNINDSHEYEMMLEFDFERSYTITYTGLTTNAGLPTEILANQTKTVTFNQTTGIPATAQDVVVSGATQSYTNPTLTLSNPTGNVTVTATISGGGGTTTIIDNGDGTTTVLTENTVENQDGSETTTTTSVNYDSNGNVTSSSSTETTEYTNGTSTSTTTNYDSSGDPVSSSTANTDTNGNVNTQLITYDNQGDPVVTGYTIDTDGNNNGGETLQNGLDTGVLVFDGHDWTATLKANITFSNVANTSPVISLSGIDDETGKLNGVCIFARKVTSGQGSKCYDENGNQQSTTTSNNPSVAFRISPYTNGTIGTYYDFYHQTGATAYYTNRFVTKSTTISLVYKIYYTNSNHQIVAEIYKSDGTTIVAKPKSQAAITFNKSLSDVTFQIGTWPKLTGDGANLTMEVISFEVTKTI